jgi:hypothetical protein
MCRQLTSLHAWAYLFEKIMLAVAASSAVLFSWPMLAVYGKYSTHQANSASPIVDRMTVRLNTGSKL